MAVHTLHTKEALTIPIDSGKSHKGTADIGVDLFGQRDDLAAKAKTGSTASTSVISGWYGAVNVPA